MTVTKRIYVICVAIILTSCTNNRFIRDNFEENVESTVAEAGDQSAYFEQAENNQVINYVVEIEKPYFSAVSDVSLKPRNYLDKESVINLPMKDATEINIFKFLSHKFGSNLKIEHGAFADEPGFNLNFQGTRKSVLDYLCQVYDCSWDYSPQNGLSITKFETRTWDLNFIPASLTMRGDMLSQATSGSQSGGGDGESGLSGSGGQSISISTEVLDVYADLIESLEAMKSEGGVVKISKSTGLLVVKDKKEILDSIDEIISTVSKNMNTVIALDVDIMKIQSNDSAELGLELDVIYNQVSNGVTFGNEVKSILDSSTDNLGIGVSDESSRFFGSTALVKALKENLNVTSHVQKSVTTMNRMTVPVSRVIQRPFEQITSNVVQNAGIVNTSTIEQKPVGRNLTILPVILNRNEIAIAFNFADSEVVGEFVRAALNNGDSTVFPITAEDKLMSRFILRDGVPQIIDSLVTETTRKSSRSLSRANSEEYEATVLVVTAKIMRNYNASN